MGQPPVQSSWPYKWHQKESTITTFVGMKIFSQCNPCNQTLNRHLLKLDKYSRVCNYECVVNTSKSWSLHCTVIDTNSTSLHWWCDHITLLIEQLHWLRERELNTSCVYWYIAAYTIWRRNTWPTTFNVCPMSRLGEICVRQQHRNWSYLPPAVQRSATERSLSPLLAPGMLYRIQCHLLRHSLLSDDF